MLEDFKKYMIKNKLSENTYKSYLLDVKLYINYYKDSYGEDFEKLNSIDIQTYKSYLKNIENQKPVTINRKLNALKKFNEYLVDKGIQNDIVIDKRDYIKIAPNFVKKDAPDEKEINKLIHKAVDSKSDTCIIILASNGGLRAEEIVNIKLIHVHLEQRFIAIIGKGEKYREVTINDKMYKALQEYLEERLQTNLDNPYLFVGKKSSFYKDKPMSRSIVNRILNKYNVEVKIEDLHPHLLRHYFGSTAYYKAGYSLIQIASQLGHSDIKTTRGYIDNHNKNMLDLSNRL